MIMETNIISLIVSPIIILIFFTMVYSIDIKHHIFKYLLSLCLLIGPSIVCFNFTNSFYAIMSQYVLFFISFKIIEKNNHILEYILINLYLIFIKILSYVIVTWSMNLMSYDVIFPISYTIYLSDILLFACLFISLPFFKNYLAKLREYTFFHVAIHVVLILIYLSYLVTVFEKGELPIESSVEIVLITLLVYLVYQMMNKVIIIEKENYLIRLHNKELQFNKTNYDNLKISIHEVKSLKHDMNHMLLSLIEDYNHQDYDKMYQSLVTELNLINDTSTIIDTGNSSLDLIIASRMNKLQKENIEFISSTFDNQIHMDKIDFYTLLGNLLDNAIENCTSQSIKKVLLDIYEEDGHLIIELKNTCTNNPFISNPSLDTTKKDVSSHGFGIDTIERIVQKYNGKITYDYSYHYFVVTLNLENQQ